MENMGLRILVIVLVAVYVLSPIDALPGPIDDIIVAILGVIVNRRLADA